MNWTEFERIIDESRTRDFQWGNHDCMQFVNRIYKTLKGQVLCPEAEKRYSTAFGARKALLEEVNGDYKLLIDRYLERVDPKLARKGDVVMFDTRGDGDAVGICLGSQFCCVTSVGLSYLPMSLALLAWKVL